jgi:uncharacterized GH25 family protein
MLLSVVDADTGTGIANAVITVRQTTGFPNSVTNKAVSDPNGACRIPVNRTTAEDWSLYVEVLKDRYALQFAHWSSARGDMIEDVPEAYQVRLAHGAIIGGMVLNEKGEPCAGARVMISGPGLESPEMQRLREGLVAGPGYHAEFTDSQGRWHCDHTPQDLDTLSFNVAHPDCVPARFGVAKLSAAASSSLVYLDEKDLRQQTATMVLKSGLVVNGSVVDGQGNPIVGAKVIENRNWNDAWAAHWTGADGRFRLSTVSTGEVTVTVEADGFVASDRTIRAEVLGEELRFVLASAAWLRGRVVDEAGASVRASVSAANGDFEAVTPKAAMSFSVEIKSARFEWSAVTDTDGRFEWRSAPPGQTRYTIQAPGYETLQRLELAADGNEHLITLLRRNNPATVRISGRVTDQQTGQPIRGFQVWMGISSEVKGRNGIPIRSWAAPVLQTTGEEGRFAFPCRERAASYTLQIKAEGYGAVELNIPGPLTNSCRFDFNLTKKQAVTGTVLTPIGQPASGATVMSCSENTRAYMNLPGQFNLATSTAAHTTTDAEGRFVLSSGTDMKLIIVAHATGYAALKADSFSSSHVIGLQSWGRVEGLLEISVGSGNGKTILLCNKPSLPGTPGLGLHASVVTDSAGRFVIENVPPGVWEIGHMLNADVARNSLIPQTQFIPIEVQAGQTTQAMLREAGVR